MLAARNHPSRPCRRGRPGEVEQRVELLGHRRTVLDVHELVGVEEGRPCRQALVRETRRMADLGYDADFLGTTLAPRSCPPGAPPKADYPELGDELDYTHFSVRMHPTRRLAWWVAWSIDGLRLFPSDSISRSGESFRADLRIPETAQTMNDAYENNELDRGHIARRSDLLWGTLTEARTANSDSFFFTNITPQHEDFNQSGRGGTWGLLENAILAQDGLEDRRLTLFAGPVLADDDPFYRDIVQLPREHWKVVVYRMDGQLSFRCFVLSQDLDRLEERVFPGFLDDFDTYLVPLDLLEERTGLTFLSLRDNASAAEPEGGSGRSWCRMPRRWCGNSPLALHRGMGGRSRDARRRRNVARRLRSLLERQQATWARVHTQGPTGLRPWHSWTIRRMQVSRPPPTVRWREDAYIARPGTMARVRLPRVSGATKSGTFLAVRELVDVSRRHVVKRQPHEVRQNRGVPENITKLSSHVAYVELFEVAVLVTNELLNLFGDLACLTDQAKNQV